MLLLLLRLRLLLMQGDRHVLDVVGDMLPRDDVDHSYPREGEREREEGDEEIGDEMGMTGERKAVPFCVSLITLRAKGRGERERER